MRLLLTLILFFAASLAYAGNAVPASCGKVDWRSKFSVPRNQQGSGICYAYVASDLLTFKLSRKVSPLDLAYMTKVMTHEPTMNFKDLRQANIIDALKAAKTIGLCKKEGFATQRQWDLMRDSVEKYMQHQSMVTPANFKNGSREIASDLRQIAQAVGDSDLDRAMHEVCDPRVPHPELQPEEITGKDAAVVDRIDEILSSKNPVPIGVEVTGPGFDKPGHGLSLIGRYYNTQSKTCDYILRNSWGLSCPKDLAELKITCDGDGNLLVPRPSLIKIMIQAAYLK